MRDGGFAKAALIAQLMAAQTARAYNGRSMAQDAFSLDSLTARVERLLDRHAALQHTHAAVLEQVAQLTQERDSLRSRLQAARARVDALIERLPAANAASTSAPIPASQTAKDAP